MIDNQMSVDDEIELMYTMWVLAFKRKEWFRDARSTRMMLEAKREALVAREKELVCQ